MSTQEFITQEDVAKVAEIAVEPSYISEIARKLRNVDDTFANMGFNRAVRIVARSVQGLKEEGRVEVNRPEYENFGGQKASSPITSIIGDSYAESGNWQEYTIVKSTETPYESVRDSFKSEVDPDVSVTGKIEQSDFISRMGKRMSILSEEILEDFLRSATTNPEVFEVSDYNDPGVDAYVQGFGWVDGEYYEQGYAVEVSIRYENKVGIPYMDGKINKVMDLESKHGVPVNLIVLAPTFTSTVTDRYSDGDVVTARELPPDANGFPVLTADYTKERRDMEDSDFAGSEYPIVDSTQDAFISDLRSVNRDFHQISEASYRQYLYLILNEALSG